jgi:8-oxo-dGTP pyrophosphatase MutT (NUDIX family)
MSEQRRAHIEASISSHITREVVRAALRERLDPWPVHNIFFRGDSQDAAVLVPVRLAPEPSALMILRAKSLKEHAGEVAFPGGKPEAGDASLRATAMREMEEEIGIRADDINIEHVGELTPVFVISGRYRIHPFVAILPDGAAGRAESPETERVLEVPLLPWITGERPILGVHFAVADTSFIAPHFELDGCVLYGATGVIFHELLLRVAAALRVEAAPVILQDKLNLYAAPRG